MYSDLNRKTLVSLPPGHTQRFLRKTHVTLQLSSHSPKAYLKKACALLAKEEHFLETLQSLGRGKKWSVPLDSVCCS